MFLQFWPYIDAYLQHYFIEFIKPQLRILIPKDFQPFRVKHFDMGDIPCQIGKLKIYNNTEEDDKIVIDMDFDYSGNAKFDVNIRGFDAGANEITLKGKLRCFLTPLLTSTPPFFGGVSFAFMELPKFKFNLTGIGDFLEYPGLSKTIQSIADFQLANCCVFPNKFVIPVAPSNIDLTDLYFPEPDGMIRIKIIEAKNLDSKDALIRQSKSDPFCAVQVGAQMFKTKTIKNSLNPKFSECFEAIVDEGSCQTLQIEIFDEDKIGFDEELGHISVPLKTVKEKGTVQDWATLEGCKRGEIHYKLQWYQLSKNRELLGHQKWDSEWRRANNPIYSSLVMVYIDRIEGLPDKTTKGVLPSPFIECKIGKRIQRSLVYENTKNPELHTFFSFFIEKSESQTLNLSAIDEGTQNLLGEVEIPLSDVTNEPEMELYQVKKYLTHESYKKSTVVLTLRVRAFKPCEVSEDEPWAFNEADEKMSVKTESLDENISLQQHTETSSESSGDDGKTAEPGKTVRMEDNESKLQLEAHQFNIVPKLPKTQKILDILFQRNKHSKKKVYDNENGAQLNFNLSMDSESSKLIVTVIKVKNIMPIEKNNLVDPYVKTELISKKGGKKASNKTAVIKNERNPCFDSTFEFKIDLNKIGKYKLFFILKDAVDYGVLHKSPVLGSGEVSLDTLNSSNQILGEQWINLTPS
uniref:Uncharacterized protein n=1 Tax=Panagrolaimus sp. ES5 TaxID=591445 RepID=A0AC34FYN3_9BILA